MRQMSNTVRGARSLLAVSVSLAIAGCGLPSDLRMAASSTSFQASADKATLPGFLLKTFKQADSNHDGVLSAKELDLSPEQFKLLDRDGNGAVDATEWQAQDSVDAIQKLWPTFQPLLEALFKRMDANHDARVTLVELRQALGVPSKYAFLNSATLSAAFQGADRNHDGALDRLEFTAFYQQLSGFNPNARQLSFDVVQALLGPYLALSSHIASQIVLHPPHRGPDTSVTPAKLGIAYEEISLHTSDNLTLRGWYIPAAVATTKAVILIHGITSNRRAYVEGGQIGMLHPEFNIVAFDLRNHGQSDGNVTTFGYYEGLDGLAAFDYAKSRGNTEVAIIGNSLGAATTIRTAALAPELKGVVDDCSYATVQFAFAGFTAVTGLPAPMLIAAATVANVDQQLSIDITSTEPVTQVSRIAPRPLLIIHGAADPYVSPDNSRINYEAAGTGFYKQLWIVPGAGHNASAETDPVGYKAHLLDLLHRAF